MRDICKILLIRTSALGDVVLTLPVLRTLRSAYPTARIDWVVEETAAPILEDNPDLSNAIILRTRKWRRQVSYSHILEMAHAIGQLRRVGYDVTLDCQGLIKSATLARLTGADMRIGFHRSHCREPLSARLYTVHVVPRSGTHIVDQQLELLRPLDITHHDLSFPIRLRREDEAYVLEFLSATLKYTDTPIAINPGATWPTKRWETEKYASLARKTVKERGIPVIITWGNEAEARQGQIIVSNAGPGVVLAPPTTIRQLAALLQRCRLVVGSDTGPLHMAAALGRPVVGLFGPSDPVRNGFYGNTSRIVHYPLPCSGCYRRQCPDPLCMRSIRVEDVFAAMFALL